MYQAIFSGNLTKDAILCGEQKETIALDVARNFKTKDGEKTEFLHVLYKVKTPEGAAKLVAYLTKGRSVLVNAYSAFASTYPKKDGTTGVELTYSANNIEFMGAPKESPAEDPTASTTTAIPEVPPFVQPQQASDGLPF